MFGDVKFGGSSSSVSFGKSVCVKCFKVSTNFLVELWSSTKSTFLYPLPLQTVCGPSPPMQQPIRCR